LSGITASGGIVVYLLRKKEKKNPDECVVRIDVWDTQMAFDVRVLSMCTEYRREKREKRDGVI